MGNSFESGRIEAFSDGVFAIAITLLVLEISIPASSSSYDHLWSAIGQQWPSYLAYVTSFWTIGGLWIVHHGVFRRMRHADYTVLLLNLLLLMLVAFLPFPTKVMADALDHTGEHAAVLFYGATLLAISISITAIARYAASRSDLIPEAKAQSEVRGIATQTTPSLGFYGVVIALAFLAPKVAAFGYLAIAIIAVLPMPTRLAPHRGSG